VEENAVTTDARDRVVERTRSVFDGWSRETTLEDMRRTWASLFTGDVVPAKTEDVVANGVPCRWVVAPDAGTDRIFLYFHGGGFQMGSPETHQALVARISAASGMAGLLIDYRLAPEHRFPAPLEDARAVFGWVLDQGIAASDMALCGDSAGGGLCLSLLLSLKGTGAAGDDKLPFAAALMSPWTDMTVSGASYRTRDQIDPLNNRSMMQTIARSYLGKTGDPKDPRASPIFGDATGLPPLLIQVGDHEVVLDDSVAFAAKARAAGVDVTLEIEPEMIHVFQIYARELPEGATAIQRIGTFLKACDRL